MYVLVWGTEYGENERAVWEKSQAESNKNKKKKETNEENKRKIAKAANKTHVYGKHRVKIFSFQPYIISIHCVENLVIPNLSNDQV